MATTIKIARTPEMIDEVFKIRHKVFHEEENLLPAMPDGRLMDRFDTFPTTRNLIVIQNNQVIGSMRLTLDSSVGLPADEYYDFRKIVPKESLLMHCGMFCVSEPFRHARITTGIMLMSSYVALSLKVNHVLAPINPAIAKLLMRVGFEKVGDEFTESHTGARMIPLVMDTSKLSDFFTDFVKKNQMLDTIGEYERTFYAKGEQVIRAGDQGKQAFIIIEGKAEVVLPGENKSFDVLKKGDVFGELALLFNEPRSADIYAVTDLQVMTLSKEAFEKMYFNNPNKMLNLVRTLAKRNKKMMKKLQYLKNNV